MNISSSKQIKLGAILSYLSIFINIVTGLLYTPWMIDSIGQANYGLYTLSNSLISLFLVDFGLSSAVSRFLSKYRAENKEENTGFFLGVVYKLYCFLDIIIAIIFILIFIFIEKLFPNFTQNELQSLKVVFCISAIFSLVNFPCVTFNGILTAYEQFIPLKLSELMYRVLVVLLTVIALINGYGLYALVVVNALCGILVIIFKFAIIKRKVSVRVNFRGFDKLILNSIMGFSMWTTIASLSQRLIFNITPTIIGMQVLEASSAISVFGVVTTLEAYTFTFSTAINGMFLPRISKILTEEKQKEKLLDLNVKVGSFQFILNGLIFVGFLLVGKSFINLWVGNDFVDAYYCLVLVIFPGIFYNSMQTINTVLIARNMVKIQAYINLAMGSVNVILSMILTKYYGVIGASFSISSAYLLRVVCLVIFVKKNHKI